MMRSHAATPLPRPMSRRGWLLLGILAALFVLAFVAVMRAYDAEGGLKVTTQGPAPTTGGGIRINLTPLAIDTQTNEMSLRLRFDPENLVGLLDGEDRLTHPLRVTIYSTDGSTEFRYQAGDQLSAQVATAGISGSLANYPFDKYQSVLWFGAEELKLSATGLPLRDKVLPTRVVVTGSVMNWNTDASTDAGWSNQTTVFMGATRVFSTQVFALLMLALMAVLAVVAGLIAELAISNRRRAEMGMLSWLAGLLFAFPALRRTMPDAPPIGVTIDILVFLWTLAFTLLAALAMALAWGVQTKAQLLAANAEHPTQAVPGADDAG